MEQVQLRNVLRLIAMREGVPEEMVLAEIEEAISEAYKRIHAEGDAAKLAIWRKISPDGVPTACEFLSYVCARVDAENP